MGRIRSLALLCASAALLLVGGSLSPSRVTAQQFSLTAQSTSVFGTQLTLCAITPPQRIQTASSGSLSGLDPSTDWSGDAISHQGTQQCFRGANTPGYNVPDVVRNAVWTGYNCVMNSTGSSSGGGFATCDGLVSVSTLPFEVLTAQARDTAEMVCVLFVNGTIGCSVGGFDGYRYPLQGLGFISFGYSPVPLEFVDATTDPPVVVQQFVQPLDSNNLEFSCVLLSNHSVRCGVIDAVFSAIVYDAAPDPPPGPITAAWKVVQMCAGSKHVCVLYESGSVYCWSGAGGCLGGACTAPSSVLFSSIDCGGAFTCGVRIDGGISCWGSPLMSNALSPPSGVFSAVIVSQQMPCAVSAIDASIQCWGDIADSYAGEALVLPTMSVVRASWLCALRKRHNPALTPSIACWSEDGRAAGFMYLPAELTYTSFLSIAVTSFYICVQLASDHTVHCSGNTHHDYASLFTLVPSPAVLGPVREIGVVPGSEQMWVWGLDGRLMAFGHTGYPHYLYPILPQAVNNNTELLWQSFHIAGQQGQALCGILTNGTALCINERSQGNSCLGVPTLDEALAMLQAGVVNSTLRYKSLHISTIYSVCANILAILSDGRAVGFGGSLTPLARAMQNSSVLTFDLRGEAAQQIVTQQVFNAMVASPGFAVCVLGVAHHVYCWILHLGGPLLTAPGPTVLITEMFADGDTLMFGKMKINDELVSWNPSGVNADGRIATLPSLALQVAPQHHYRYRAGPVLPCPPGTFSLGSGSITPVCSGLCAAGRYGNASLNTDASCAGACPRGFYCPAGTALPIPCPAGSYGNQEGLVNAGCSGSCLPGFYCPAGSWRPDAQPCAPGFMSKQPDEPCAKCERNTYSGLAPSSECTPCPPNSFAPTAGLSSCLACPSTGIECGLGSATILEGHWAHMSNLSAGQFDADGFGPFVCPPDYCDGGGDTESFAPGATAPLVNPCSPHRSLDEDNPLCGRCDAGYWEWNSVCMDCPPVNWPILAVLILLSFLVVIVLHVLSQRSTSSARLSILIYFAQTALLLLRARSNDELSRVFAWLHVFNLSITAPTGSTCLAQLSGQQTMMLEAFLPLASLLPLMVLAFARWCWMRCACCRGAQGAAPSHASAAEFLAAPPVSAAAAYAAAHRPFPWHEYVRTAITVSLIAYQQLCVTILSYLQCVPVGPYRVVFSRPSIDCTSSDYKALQPLAILLIIFLAGVVPAALAWFLYKHRDIIWAQQNAMMHMEAQQQQQQQKQQQQLAADPHPAGRDGAYSPPADRSLSPSFPDSVAVLPSDMAVGLADCDGGGDDESVPASLVSSTSALQFTRRFSALYLSYTPSSYLWLPLLLLRRVALVMCAVLLLTLPDYQQLVFSLLCLLMLCSHVSLHPFCVELDNRLETMSLLALLALSQVLASQAGSPSDASMPVSLQLLSGALLVAPLSTILFFIVQFNLQRPAARAIIRAMRTQFPCCAGLCLPQPQPTTTQDAATHGGAVRARSGGAGSGGSVSLEESLQGFSSSSSSSSGSLKALQAQMRTSPPMMRSPSPRDRDHEQAQAQAAEHERDIKAALLANAHHP